MRTTFLFIVIGLMVLSCKNKPSANRGDNVVQEKQVSAPDVVPPNVNPDDCLVLAKVFTKNQTSTGLLIEDVKEVGFSFKQPLSAGDTIWVSNQFSSSDSLFVLNYAPAPGGGKYSATKFTKK